MCRIASLFFFQAEDGIRDVAVTGVQTCALPIWRLVLRRDAGEFPCSSKSSSNVVFSQLLIRRGKYFLGAVYFNQLAEEKERRQVRDPRRLLHIMRDYHDRVLLLKVNDQFFDLRRRDR